MLKSCYWSIVQVMAFDEFYAFENKICNLIGFSMNLSLMPASLMDAGIPW